MHDMLVKLYGLPGLEEALEESARRGVIVRRALCPEKPIVCAWVQAHFPVSAAEVEAAFCRAPITCFIAIREQRMVGFACYDVTCRNFFGPEAVLEEERGRGTGRTLLLAALHDQKAQGYAYSIIGGVGPAEFYERTVGATSIAGSTPGIYASMMPLKSPAD